MCSRHFLKSDYSRRSDGATSGLNATRTLKPGAVLYHLYIFHQNHMQVCIVKAVKMKVTGGGGGGGGVSVVSSAGTAE